MNIYWKIAVVFVALLALNIFADGVENGNISQNEMSISVTTNEVIFVQGPRGDRAVIQFVTFMPQKAAYRWRLSDASESKSIVSSNGVVVESYERRQTSNGSYQLTPKVENNTTIRIGEINMEWSCGSITNGWLYYDSNRFVVKKLSVKAFDESMYLLSPVESKPASGGRIKTSHPR